MRIVLASNSPRRKELLAKIVPDFDILPSLSPEVTSATDPKQYATELARHKATDVLQTHNLASSDVVVVGCDTVVDLDGNIMGKPRTPEHAVQMLNSLSGKTHFVHTGVCIICGKQTFSFCDSTAVTFKQLSQSEIVSYVKSGGAMDKAGAYGIQECGFVAHYNGSYDNVVGFPTERISEIFNKLGIKPNI